MNKNNCHLCGKKTNEKCIAMGNKKFCCRVCCDKYKKGAKKTEPKKPVNVCRFC